MARPFYLNDIIHSMTVYELLSLYKKHLTAIVLGGMVGGMLGAAACMLTPPKYIASGSFYVSRGLEAAPLEFKYEGYYSSLSSINFAKSLAALIESDDVKKQVLQAQNQPVSRKSLKNLDRAVSVKKPDTQLVTLQTKAGSVDQAQQLWTTYKDTLISVSNSLNKNGDANIVVSTVSSTPATFQSFKSLPLSIALGAFVGVFVSMFFYGTYYFAKKGLANETI